MTEWSLRAGDGPSLQDGIDQAGSPIDLLWRTQVAPWVPAVVEPEYVGWRKEQESWQSGVALMDLSYHMWDSFIEGPDATRLLADYSANNFEKFAINQAKQFVPVTADGILIGDGILLRRGEDEYVLTGRSTAQSWITFHAEKGGYDVEIRNDPDCSKDPEHTPPFFRYQVQGPHAQEMIESVFDGPLPEVPFFHAPPVDLNGHTFRALRHGMAGQPGYEFIGDYMDHEFVKEALLKAGEPLGLVHVGSLAYPSAQCESGWIPTPTPGFYTSLEDLEYRNWATLNTVDGRQPLHGSFFSPDIEDYYVSPWEIGYGRSVSFNHDFLGRDALMETRDSIERTKVTLVANPDDVREKIGTDHLITAAKHRVESDGDLAGIAMYCAYNDPMGTILSLAIVDRKYAEPGTEVTLVMGDHPGPGADSDADLGLPELRATVQPSPYNEFARTEYRRD